MVIVQGIPIKIANAIEVFNKKEITLHKQAKHDTQEEIG